MTDSGSFFDDFKVIKIVNGPAEASWLAALHKKWTGSFCNAQPFLLSLQPDTRVMPAERAMINRELIRLKVVQLVYAYYRDGDKKVESTEKELMFSLSKSYDMYRYLLLIIVELYEYGLKSLEIRRSRARRLNITEKEDTAFTDNRFARQLSENALLGAFREKVGAEWIDETLIRNLYRKVIESDEYKEYRSIEAPAYADDRTFWRKVYKSFFMGSDELDAYFEERSLYWNDDKAIVDSFVLKTIKRFDESAGGAQPLLPEYDSEDDRRFAAGLIHETLANGDCYRQLIRDNAKNWEYSRLAFMDLIIMQVALAEIMTCPTIPVAVSINEYLEIAKMYSTPRSHIYINGLLDATVKILRASGKIMK